MDSSVKCNAVCADGYGNGQGITPGKCSLGTWTSATGGCSALSCYINAPPATLKYTNCTADAREASGVVCQVACADGYDTPVGLTDGSCNAGTYTKPTGSCSPMQCTVLAAAAQALVE